MIWSPLRKDHAGVDGCCCFRGGGERSTAAAGDRSAFDCHRTGPDSAAAGRFGFDWSGSRSPLEKTSMLGCRDLGKTILGWQMGARLPATGPRSAAADKAGCRCRRQIRFGRCGQIRVRVVRIPLRKTILGCTDDLEPAKKKPFWGVRVLFVSRNLGMGRDLLAHPDSTAGDRAGSTAAPAGPD